MAPRAPGDRRGRRTHGAKVVVRLRGGRAQIDPAAVPPEVTDDAHLVRIAIAANDHELATSTVAAAERRSELNPEVRTIAAIATHARGLLTRDTHLFAQAVELLDDGHRPLALASALEDLGAARVKSGSTQGGIEALERALTIYAQSGAGWDAGRVRSRLRVHGVRRRLVTSEREETGWAAMTDSELAVARLVAQGLTNREVAEQLFVSPHTVSSHLRRVFAKLDINSRVELTRLAGDHERHP
jgi:DNA-binding CsgD family transcriptional regulator